MGELSNTNAISMTVPSAAMDETPTHFTIWNHATLQASGNFVTQGSLLDDDTNATPIFDVAEDGTITFDAGDLTLDTTVNSSLGERFYQDALRDDMSWHLQLHTGAPGTNHTSNKATIDRFNVAAWSYAT